MIEQWVWIFQHASKRTLWAVCSVRRVWSVLSTTLLTQIYIFLRWASLLRDIYYVLCERINKLLEMRWDTWISVQSAGEIGRKVLGKFINSKLQVYARTITPLEIDEDLRLHQQKDWNLIFYCKDWNSLHRVAISACEYKNADFYATRYNTYIM